MRDNIASKRLFSINFHKNGSIKVPRRIKTAFYRIFQVPDLQTTQSCIMLLQKSKYFNRSKMNNEKTSFTVCCQAEQLS